jgi:hypothetical protein
MLSKNAKISTNSCAIAGLVKANCTPNQNATTITIRLSINNSCNTAFFVSFSSGLGFFIENHCRTMNKKRISITPVG